MGGKGGAEEGGGGNISRSPAPSLQSASPSQTMGIICPPEASQRSGNENCRKTRSLGEQQNVRRADANDKTPTEKEGY